MAIEFIVLNAFLFAALYVDLGILGRRGGVVQFREALLRWGVWVALAFLFAGGIFWWRGAKSGLEFLTGYIIEQSLSIDNIFLLVLIFQHFKVPKSSQRVLLWGVMGALLMRMGLIFLGCLVVLKYAWVLYILGGFLLLTGAKMLLSPGKPENVKENFLILLLRKWFKISDSYDGDRFITRQKGKRVLTPLFLVLMLVESTDLLFALDSIPAIFSITQDPFIVYAANAFAIMGLRSLYFAIAHMMDRFRYLKVGLSLVLVFIGGKMLLGGIFHVPVVISLCVTISILGAAVIFSLRKQTHKR